MTWIAKRLLLNIDIIVGSCLTNVECEKLALSYTKFQDLQKNAPNLKHLAEFINSANWNKQTPHHKLVRRQTTDESTFTEEDAAFCKAQLHDVSCSTGILQGFIDAELICGRYGIEQAQRDENVCARNERGQYCLSALSLFELRRDDIIGNCFIFDTSSACPTACRTQLEHFRSNLGCCINAFINSSLNSGYCKIVDYRLWNLCNVPLPAEACDNGPTINLPVNVQECTEEEYFTKRYTQNICLPQHGQPYINAIVLNSRCKSIIFSFNSGILGEFLFSRC